MKRICALLIVLSFSITVYAQWGCGVRLGAELSTVHSPGKMENPKMVLMPQLGAFCSYSLTTRLGIQQEISYLKRGYTNEEVGLNDEDGSYSYRRAVRTHYLAFPTLLKVYATENLHFMAGMNNAVLLKQKTHFYDGLDRETPTPSPKRYYFGLIGGVEYAFEKNVVLGVRYDFGFTSQHKNVDSMQPRTFEFFVGWAFR